MRQEVTLNFGRAGTVTAHLHPGAETWAPDRARRWLDDQFVALECEPLRVSGKVLSADKVLAVAGALGLERLTQDEALRDDFARAVTAALGRPLVTVDVDAGSVTF
jgi:hypothetical protein